MPNLLTWFHAVVGFEAAGVAPVDRPGSLDAGVTVTGSGRNRRHVFASVLSDPDGIASVGRASVTASDGQTSAITFARRDANTFTHSTSRRNARWAAGTMTVSYTDGAGNSVTLTDTWTT